MKMTETKYVTGAGQSKRRFMTTKRMALMGVMTAVICVLGPIAIPIPFSPVPLSFTILAIYLTVYVLGAKAGTISYLIYLLLGMAGLPVFSGFSGGIGKLAGPTGGYLLGFIPLALIAGFMISRFPGRPMLHAVGMVLGLAVCYSFGTVWLSVQLGISFTAALAIGVLPYLPGDALKIAGAMFLGPKLKREVHKVED